MKSRLGAMLGPKSFATDAITIRGVELMHRIRKGQFDLRTLTTNGRSPSEIWATVLASMLLKDFRTLLFGKFPSMLFVELIISLPPDFWYGLPTLINRPQKDCRFDQ